MGPTQLLIQDFADRKHQLGRAIEVGEVEGLIIALRRRLKVSEAELDLSPKSLKRLERRLSEYYHETEEQGCSLDDEELVRLVREIAAYFGQVLVFHANGRWDNATAGLYFTGISIEGSWRVQKEGIRSISHFPTTFMVGLGAAGAWDALAEGRKLGFYRTYRDAISKRIKEQLP